MPTTRSRPWAVPAFGVVLGLAFLAAHALNDELGRGFVALGIMVGYAVLLVVFRRYEWFSMMGGGETDERAQAVGTEAAAFTGHVMVGVVIGMFFYEIATGGDGQPWSTLGAVGGVSFGGAVYVLGRRR